MKPNIEINRKEYDELPEHIKNDLSIKKHHELNNIIFTYELYKIIQEIEDKCNYRIREEDLNYAFYGSTNFIILNNDVFSDLFHHTLINRWGSYVNYILNVELNSKGFGVSWTNDPYPGIKVTPRKDILVNLSKFCPETSKATILKEADNLYKELHDIFLNGYDNLFNISSGVAYTVNQELRNKYYYLDNNENLKSILNKNDFKNEEEADKFAKKELFEQYTKKPRKLKLSI